MRIQIYNMAERLPANHAGVQIHVSCIMERHSDATCPRRKVLHPQ